jgi:excisionase family DNA binding protein
VEVAKVLNIGIRTIWRWADTGVMPAPIRAGVNGRIVRWNRAVIERWVAEGCLDQRGAAS